jgi:hypothetical protein
MRWGEGRRARPQSVARTEAEAARALSRGRGALGWQRDRVAAPDYRIITSNSQRLPESAQIWRAIWRETLQFARRFGRNTSQITRAPAALPCAQPASHPDLQDHAARSPACIPFYGLCVEWVPSCG